MLMSKFLYIFWWYFYKFLSNFKKAWEFWGENYTWILYIVIALKWDINEKILWPFRYRISHFKCAETLKNTELLKVILRNFQLFGPNACIIHQIASTFDVEYEFQIYDLQGSVLSSTCPKIWNFWKIELQYSVIYQINVIFDVDYESAKAFSLLV